MTDGRGADAEVWLPSGAPDKLVDFVHGRTPSVEIDTSEVGWLPLPADVSPFAETSVVIDHGWTPTAVSFEIGWGQFGLASPIVRVVIVDGMLTFTTSGLSDGTVLRLSAWAASFNRALSANHRQLDSLRVDGSNLRIATRSPLPTALADPAVPVPVALAGLWALRRSTAPELPPWTQRSRVAKTLMAVAIVLLFGGGAVVVATALRDGGGDGGDDDTALPATTARSDPVSTTDVTTGPLTTDVTTTDVSTTDVSVSVLGPEPPTTPSVDTTITTEVTATSDVTTTSESRISFGPEPPPPPTTLPPSSGDRTKTSVPSELLETCGESTVRVDVDADGVADDCAELDFYLTEVGLPPVPGVVPPGPVPTLARTGSDNNFALQLGILLILAGLTAMVASHRRSNADRPEQHSG